MAVSFSITYHLLSVSNSNGTRQGRSWALKHRKDLTKNNHCKTFMLIVHGN